MKDIIEITENGDPFGSGYVGSMSTDNGHSWFYRGDIGPRPQSFWREYCRMNHYVLRVV